SYYISVDQATLLVRKARINPSAMLGHALALEKTTAKYPIKRVVVKQHTIGKRVSSKVITNISSTSLTSRVVIGFVRNSAYDGPVFATGNDISREDYPKGYSLFAFDLTPDLCSCDQFYVIKTGNLDVGLTFADSLDDSIVVIFYLEYDNLLEINKKF
ncbi:unnamed protein product, partial [Brachionus calyciflorus]